MRIGVVGVGCRGWVYEVCGVRVVDERWYGGCEVNNDCYCWCGCGNDRSLSWETLALRGVDAKRCTVGVLYRAMVAIKKNE